MKKYIFLIIVIIATTIKVAYGQDVITMKNGDEVKAKILEILPDAVTYKKFDNLDGPSYTESKSNIFMIRYKNGSKDVFKEQSQSSANVVASSDEEKKSHAVEKLQAVFSELFKGIQNPIMKFVSFKKTNGVLRTVNGQFIYEIDFELTIQFLRNGYKIGNGMVGYWRDFKVWPTSPELNQGDAFVYSSLLFPAGTVVVLEGVANMASSDNGYEFNGYEIQKAGLAGVQQVSTTNSANNSISNGNRQFMGYYNSNYSGGEYQLVNNTVNYKSNSATITSLSFGGITGDSTPGDIKINGNAILSTFLYIIGFRRTDDKYSFTYSLCITLDNGVEFEKKEGIQSFNENDPCIFQFDYNTPSLKNGASAKFFYMNFVVKDDNSDAIVQGYYKFKLLP